MNNDQIESLLRRARPRELPAGLKHRVLQAARQNAEPIAWAPRFAWTSLAVCWTLIVLLRTTTPDVPNGTLPFDREAFLVISLLPPVAVFARAIARVLARVACDL